jgi:succinate dehydrogenase / fumarate reductase cytochrome b subunit
MINCPSITEIKKASFFSDIYQQFQILHLFPDSILPDRSFVCYSVGSLYFNQIRLMALSNRPISPHLQLYKLPLTGFISIIHRITGTVLAIGLLFFIYSFCAIATGAEDYAQLQALVNHPLVSFKLMLFIYALFFHFCHGIRHLIWDTGASFDKATLNQYAFIELVASATLTLFAVLFI